MTPPDQKSTAPAEQVKIWEEILSKIRGTHPSCRGNPQYLVGIEEGYGPRFVPAKDLTHVLVAGVTGSGKSIWLLSQILQDVLRGNSVFVFDPHGDLAERLLTHIPRERWDDVVYINPLTAKQFGRVVRFNFLEVREGEEPTFVKRAFMDALQKNYPDFWGPRLDAILSHAIDLLFEQRDGVPTLPKLGRVLSKKTYREGLLKESRSEAVKDFWYTTFPKYKDDAITAAQNKLYRILEEVLISPITSAERSTVDFWSLMQGRKIVIFDLREGALTPEITSFIGTLFLARIYQAGMARERIPEEERSYVRVYVDEAGRFMTNVLRDTMQALRKYNVFLTVVCQSLEQFAAKGADLSQYANTVVAFQCAHDTAKALEGFFPKLPAERPEHRHEHLERVKFYSFYLSTIVGTKRENYYLNSIDPGIGPSKPEEVIARSLELYGEPYDIRAAMPKIELPRPALGPAAYLALQELELRGEVSEETIQDKLTKFEKAAIVDALFSLRERGFATYEWRRGPRANQRFWRITEEGLRFLYPTSEIWSNRLGGAKHIAMLCLACKLYREMGVYPAAVSGVRELDRVRVGEGEVKVDLYPDLILYPQYFVSETRSNPVSWDLSRVVAAEVEAYPTGGRYTGAHLDRTKAHFVKARDLLKMPVIFLVMTEAEAQAVKRAIQEEGANIVGNVFHDYAPGNASVRVLGREYEELIKRDMRTGTALAMQVKRLVEMSRQADISEIAEPEDFYEEGLVPEYASHRRLEELKRLEGAPVEEIPAPEAPKPEEEPKPRAPEVRAPPEEEPKPRAPEIEEIPFDARAVGRLAAKIAGLKAEGGWMFWVERIGKPPREVEYLFAGRMREGQLEKVHVGYYDDLCKEVLRELGVTLEEGPPSPLPQPQPVTPAQPETPQVPAGKREEEAKAPEEARRGRVRELKLAGAKWTIKKISGKEYCYARLRDKDGKRRDVSLGPLDEELRKILREEGIIFS